MPDALSALWLYVAEVRLWTISARPVHSFETQPGAVSIPAAQRSPIRAPVKTETLLQKLRYRGLPHESNNSIFKTPIQWPHRLYFQCFSNECAFEITDAVCGRVSVGQPSVRRPDDHVPTRQITKCRSKVERVAFKAHSIDQINLLLSQVCRQICCSGALGTSLPFCLNPAAGLVFYFRRSWLFAIRSTCWIYSAVWAGRVHRTPILTWRIANRTRV